MPRFAVPVALLLALAAPAARAAVLDQEQPALDPEAGFLGIGGDSEQMLAQTVTAGITGRLVEVHLPVNCLGGPPLIVEIRELDGDRPSDRVLRGMEVPWRAVEPLEPPAFRAIAVEPSLGVSAGDRFAIVLRTEGGICNLVPSPAGDRYARGEGYFDARPNPPGWVALSEVPDEDLDYPFKTFVEVPGPRRGRDCLLPQPPPPRRGPPPPPITLPADLPICRCLEDPGFAEHRCGLFHPDFFLSLRIPRPVRPGRPFQVEWTLLPLGELKAPVTIAPVLPPGFQGGPREPVTFPAGAPPGQSRTVSYRMVAGPQAGDLELSSTLSYPRPGSSEVLTGTFVSGLEVAPAKTLP